MVKPVVVHVRFPQQLPAAKDEEQVIQACLRGLAHAADKLGGASRADLSIYVYPDPRSIASLTGQCGDGHAIVEARVPHVVRYDPAEGGGFEKLLAHEGTHALAYPHPGAAREQKRPWPTSPPPLHSFVSIGVHSWLKAVTRGSGARLSACQPGGGVRRRSPEFGPAGDGRESVDRAPRDGPRHAAGNAADGFCEERPASTEWRLA